MPCLHAQTAPPSAPLLDPLRNREVAPLTAPASEDLRLEGRKDAPAVPGTAQESARRPAPKPAPDPQFDVLEYAVEGNTVLTPIAIERAVYPHLGENRTIRDIERARAALEAAYRDAGYATVIVDIPVQKVDEGLVRLAVTEGRVERVRVTGSLYYSQGFITESAAALAQNEVPYFPEVQRQLDRLNRTPDRRVTPVLRPGSAPSTTEFELKVEDSLPLHGSLEFNNRQSLNTSDLRLSAAARYDNLWQRGHGAGLQYQMTPQKTDEVKVLFLTYSVPLEAGGSLYAYYVRARSNVGALGDITVLGSGQIYGLRLGLPLPGVGRFSQQLTLGWDVKDFREDVAQPGAPAVQTPVRYQPLSVDWSGGYQSRRSSTQFSLGAIFSVRGPGNNAEQFANKRFKAQGNFAALRWNLQRTQALGKDYSLYAKLEGQLSGEPLVANEQFFAGGAQSVRGYYESEALGDKGMRWTFELRSPSVWDGGEGSWLREARWNLFVDGAVVSIHEPLAGENRGRSLASAGLGLRLLSVDKAELALNFAVPLKETADTREGRLRTLFSAAWRF